MSVEYYDLDEEFYQQALEDYYFDEGFGDVVANVDHLLVDPEFLAGKRPWPQFVDV